MRKSGALLFLQILIVINATAGTTPSKLNIEGIFLGMTENAAREVALENQWKEYKKNAFQAVVRTNLGAYDCKIKIGYKKESSGSNSIVKRVSQLCNRLNNKIEDIRLYLLNESGKQRLKHQTNNDKTAVENLLFMDPNQQLQRYNKTVAAHLSAEIRGYHKFQPSGLVIHGYITRKLYWDSVKETAPDAHNGTKFNAGEHYRAAETHGLQDEATKLGSVILVGIEGCENCDREIKVFRQWSKEHPELKTEYVPLMKGILADKRTNSDILAKAHYIAKIYDNLGVPKARYKDESWSESIARTKHALLRSEPDLRKYFTSLELRADSKYDEIDKSFSLYVKLQRAKKVSRIDKLEIVPTYVVNGKYLVPIEFFRLINKTESKWFPNKHRKLLDIVAYLLEHG